MSNVAAGAERVAWTRTNMPLLAVLRAEYAEERPLAGRRLGMCLHVEPKNGRARRGAARRRLRDRVDTTTAPT